MERQGSFLQAEYARKKKPTRRDKFLGRRAAPFHTRYLRDFIRRHQIPVLRPGRLIRFDAHALQVREEALRQLCCSLSADVNRPAHSRSAACWARRRNQAVSRRLLPD